jgi:urease accessory protein
MPPLRRADTRTITATTIMVTTITIMDTAMVMVMATTGMTTRTMITIMTTAGRPTTSMITTIITVTRIRTVMGRSKGAAPRPRVSAPAVQSDATAAAEYAALYRLMTWLSPSFPVGAFSYSSGIEWAVEAGDIGNAQTLQDWLSAMLSDGASFCDGVFLCHAWRAAAAGDDIAATEVLELAAAFAPSRERHLETTAQGRAFAEIASATWNCAALDRLLKIASGPIAYPVVVGTVAAGHGVRLDLTLHAFLHAQAANWISAGVRLIPLGQTDSQRVMAALEPAVAAAATRALGATLDDIGSATFRADLASMRHETQYTRLFRT